MLVSPPFRFFEMKLLESRKKRTIFNLKLQIDIGRKENNNKLGIVLILFYKVHVCLVWMEWIPHNPRRNFLCEFQCIEFLRFVLRLLKGPPTNATHAFECSSKSFTTDHRHRITQPKCPMSTRSVLIQFSSLSIVGVIANPFHVFEFVNSLCAHLG